MSRSSTATVSLHPDHASEHPVDLCHVFEACEESKKVAWELLRQTMEDACQQHAHEIHFEPDEECWRLRYRSPFNFTEVRVENVTEYQSSLELLESHLWGTPQSELPRRGWFGFIVQSTEQLLQLDVVPSARGKTHLITFLQPLKTPPPTLDELAMTRAQRTQIRSFLHQSSGMTLIASDIAHARARTARAFAQELVAPDKKIVCVDSPGHPLLTRTTQLAMDTPPTNAQVQNWTAMCQLGCDAIIACQTLDDELTPDLIQLATEQTYVVQSARVKTVADAIAKLLALGIRCEAIARTLSAVVVLRQAQCVCQYCRQSQVPDDDGTNWLAKYSPIKPSNINDWLRQRMRSSFSYGPGCNRCGNTGIGNALEIYDIVPIDNAVKDALYDSDIRYALSLLQSQTTLPGQLLKLAQEGIITLTEASRLAPVADS
ncbi:MAG: MSHA biogenesis protein MshE [bacterium]|jgi:MSHA biogenesis protein MshE